MAVNTSYEVDSIQQTSDNSIVWILRQSSSLNKRPPEVSRYGSLLEMLCEAECGMTEQKESSGLNQNKEDSENLSCENMMSLDEGWIKRLRRLAKCLIKIKNHRTHSFNEEVGMC